MTVWQADAACRDFPEAFDDRLDGFETDDLRNTRHRTAARICSTCRVARACLEDALTDSTAEGIRAGYLFPRRPQT